MKKDIESVSQPLSAPTNLEDNSQLTKLGITSLFNNIKKSVDEFNKNNILTSNKINQRRKTRNNNNNKILLLKNKINELNKYNQDDLIFKYDNGKRITSNIYIKKQIAEINDSINKLNEKIYPGKRDNGKDRIPKISFKSSKQSKKLLIEEIEGTNISTMNELN